MMTSCCGTGLGETLRARGVWSELAAAADGSWKADVSRQLLVVAKALLRNAEPAAATALYTAINTTIMHSVNRTTCMGA